MSHLRPLLLPLVPGLLFALACGGGGGSTPNPTAPATPAPSAPAAKQAVPEAREAALSEHYLVILGSKKDPNEEIPGLATLAAHPEIAAKVERLSSSRFKNLMPCYTVTIAGASKDKSAANDLSAKLRAIGVDNYVKNAGKFVGVAKAIDDYCSRGDVAATGLAQLATQYNGEVFVPIALPEATRDNLVEKAPKPQNLDPDGFSAWKQALPLDRTDAIAKGDAYKVVSVQRGDTRSCTVTGFALLTLGIPHFGQLQDGNKLKAPACGEPEPFAVLDCGPGEEDGAYIASAAKNPTPVTVPLQDDANPKAKAALEAALAKQSGWTSAPASDMGPAERSTTLRRGTFQGKPVWVGEGLVDSGGPCGGEVYSFVGAWIEEGGALREIVPLERHDNTMVLGLVDLDGSGGLSVVEERFPSTVQVTGAGNNPRAVLETAFCDCPC